MPYAERYISLVIERKWHSSRMHQRDVSKLDHDIEESLVDYERALLREAIVEAEEAEKVTAASSSRSTRVLLQPISERRPAQGHPWNQRAVLPKK